MVLFSSKNKRTKVSVFCVFAAKIVLIAERVKISYDTFYFTIFKLFLLPGILSIRPVCLIWQLLVSVCTCVFLKRILYKCRKGKKSEINKIRVIAHFTWVPLSSFLFYLKILKIVSSIHVLRTKKVKKASSCVVVMMRRCMLTERLTGVTFNVFIINLYFCSLSMIR